MEEEKKADEDPVYPLSARLLWVQHAFCSLSRCRTVNETGPQPMTFTDILAYCELQGIFDEESRQDLIFFLTELDIRYLKHSHEQIRKSREDAERKAKHEADRKRRR